MKRRLVALLLLAGCASSGARPTDELPVVTRLTVTNQRGEDEAIYVMYAGVRGRRLGHVTSFGTATFYLRASDAPIASDIQFVAKTIVSGIVDVSEPIGAERGAEYDWKLGPGRHADFLSLRYTTR